MEIYVWEDLKGGRVDDTRINPLLAEALRWWAGGDPVVVSDCDSLFFDLGLLGEGLGSYPY